MTNGSRFRFGGYVLVQRDDGTTLLTTETGAIVSPGPVQMRLLLLFLHHPKKWLGDKQLAARAIDRKAVRNAIKRLCTSLHWTLGNEIKTERGSKNWMLTVSVEKVADDEAMEAAAAPKSASRRVVVVLPPIDTQGFVGRQLLVDRLKELLIDGQPSASGLICGLYGPPGIGKSALAVHFAFGHSQLFPGGVFGVDLRGVKDPAEVVSRFAIAMREPLTSDEESYPLHQVMQTRFAVRRCLLVLDNLEHGKDLKHLRPGGAASVLITCRDQDVLAQFSVPTDHCIPVGLLHEDEARQYLHIALGASSHTNDEIKDLAKVLRYLPLALRIGVRLVLEEPRVHDRIPNFINRLQGTSDLVEKLIVADEPDMDVVRLFALSLNALSESEQRAFACLSVCACHDFGVTAATAVATTITPDPAALLARLVRLSLIELDQKTGRYRFHALLDHYANSVGRQWGLIADARRRHAEAIATLLRDSPTVLLQDLADVRVAVEYLVDQSRLELPVLQGLNRLVELTSLGHWHYALLSRARTNLDPAVDPWLTAVLLLQEGKRCAAIGNLPEARLRFQESLQMRRALSDRAGEAMVLHSLAGLLRNLGHMDDALSSFERSLEIGREAIGEHHAAVALRSLGWLFRERGEPREGALRLEKSRQLAGRLAIPLGPPLKWEINRLKKWAGDLENGSMTLSEYHLKMAKQRFSARDWPGAIIHRRRNLELDHTPSNRGERKAQLAHAYFKANRFREAVTTSAEALAEGFENGPLQANWGRALHVAGEPLTESEKHLRRAVQIDPGNAWARSWLGRVLADLGRIEDAEASCRQALVGHKDSILLSHLARVLALYPDQQAAKLEEALQCCAEANELSSPPIAEMVQLATELRSRLERTSNPRAIARMLS